MDLNSNYHQINLDYCRASTIKRSFNYIIDTAVFYILAFVFLIAVRFLKPELLTAMDSLTMELILPLFFGIGMFLTEAIFRGKSIGKLITGTRAVNRDGSEITYQKAFIRNIIRAMPFIWLSAFRHPCNPWHDSGSDTLVIEEKKIALQRQKMALFGSVKNKTI